MSISRSLIVQQNNDVILNAPSQDMRWVHVTWRYIGAELNIA
jgi:hypothetical protein